MTPLLGLVHPLLQINDYLLCHPTEASLKPQHCLIYTQYTTYLSKPGRCWLSALVCPLNQEKVQRSDVIGSVTPSLLSVDSVLHQFELWNYLKSSQINANL